MPSRQAASVASTDRPEHDVAPGDVIDADRFNPSGRAGTAGTDYGQCAQRVVDRAAGVVAVAHRTTGHDIPWAGISQGPAGTLLISAIVAHKTYLFQYRQQPLYIPCGQDDFQVQSA